MATHNLPFMFVLFLFLFNTISATMPTDESPTHFVLVHGASHGGWCWFKIRALLENAGFKVSCPDLRSAGIDPADANTLSTFQEYTQPLHDLLASLPHAEKVILVGHSFGGFSITDAIDNFPEKIQAAVYVAAAMLRNSWPFEKNIKNEQEAPDALSIFNSNLECFFKKEGSLLPTSCIFRKELQRELLYNLSPLEDSTLAGMLLRPSPFRSFINAPFPSNLKNVPRVYVKTLQDNLLKPRRQDLMVQLWRPSQVYTIDSDHSAMLSKPFELFDILVSVAANFTSTSNILLPLS
ncbi:unnamed protein product [Amaranthus hypochondriacus]